ncbi:CLUMA_CG002887, isoform A [Clunio marinus]|uniref:CLUMA_CG002887, isoform A n=1 Tax=Clunio marinus TaxID=568069 RepID=A0A1J1HL49_9DIPT|nr:CLUMA_CG002887, isoform A [Clunio marinus]
MKNEKLLTARVVGKASSHPSCNKETKHKSVLCILKVCGEEKLRNSYRICKQKKIITKTYDFNETQLDMLYWPVIAFPLTSGAKHDV